jgi:hypothetical protein
MSTLRSAAAAALVSLFAFAGTAHAQGTTTVTSPFSGTFSTAHFDTNLDGVRVSRQLIRATAPDGTGSTLEGLNEFALRGPGTCPNGAAGTTVAFLPGPNAPASIIQTFDNGDQLILAQTSGTACLDLASSTLFAQVGGTIVRGTGSLQGATGTFMILSTAQFLFFNLVDAFGPQSGTITQTITLP